jgi:hypothetical protein
MAHRRHESCQRRIDSVGAGERSWCQAIDGRFCSDQATRLRQMMARISAAASGSARSRIALSSFCSA